MRDEPLRGTCPIAMDCDSPPPKFQFNDAAALRVRRAPAAAFSPMSSTAPRRQTGQNLVPGSAVLTRQDRIGAVMFAGTRPSRGCATGGRRSDCVKKSCKPTTDMGGSDE
jgi:hypothetical protein